MTRSDILDACACGEISPNIALSRLLLAGEAVDADAFGRDAAERPGAAPIAALQALADRHAGRLVGLGRLAASGLWPDGADTFGETARLFDRLALEAPEAGVAFYSLGDPVELAAATAELVEVVRAWAPPAGRRVLDVGCGIGRLTLALAGEAREVIGLDVSEGMVAEARRRAAGRARVRFEHSDGRALPVANGSAGLVIAADSFPYVVQAGETGRFLDEAGRVLAPGGDLLVFNWSYRGAPPLDEAEARTLGPLHGFDVLRAGERPFRIWDGVGFHLRRRA